MSKIAKKSVMVAGHRTSVSLEPAFWAELRRIAEGDGVSLAQCIAAVDAKREGNLSSALRVHILERLKKMAGNT